MAIFEHAPLPFLRCSFRVNRQAEASEIPVKGQTGHAIEHFGDYHERERVAKGEFLVL
jgi:hypothetical protein